MPSSVPRSFEQETRTVTAAVVTVARHSRSKDEFVTFAAMLGLDQGPEGLFGPSPTYEGLRDYLLAQLRTEREIEERRNKNG